MAIFYKQKEKENKKKGRRITWNKLYLAPSPIQQKNSRFLYHEACVLEQKIIYGTMLL